MIVGGGMTIHNLRTAMPEPRAGGRNHLYPFTPAFNDATEEAATARTGTQREDDMRSLFKREDLRVAHPSLEHLTPLVPCYGAIGEDVGKCLFKTVEYGAMGGPTFVLEELIRTEPKLRREYNGTRIYISVERRLVTFILKNNCPNLTSLPININEQCRICPIQPLLAYKCEMISFLD
jgi:hypothetical protein